MSQEATIFIVDDDQAMSESLAWMIESVGFKTKTYLNAQDFLKDYHEQAGCLILDVRMPEISGLELQEELNQRALSLPIIFISGHGDIPLAVRVMKAGAIDFLAKPFNDQVLLEAINKAIRIDKKNREHLEKNNETIERVSQLTPREYQVMCYIVEGKLNKVISSELNISLKTVEAHRASVMKKLNARSVSELVKLALTNNLCNKMLASHTATTTINSDRQFYHAE